MYIYVISLKKIFFDSIFKIDILIGVLTLEFDFVFFK